MYQTNRYSNKQKLSSKPSFMSSTSEFKHGGSVEDLSMIKNHLKSSELNQSLETPRRPKETKRSLFPQKHRQEDEGEDAPFATDISMVDRGAKTNGSMLRKEKQADYARTDSRIQVEGLVD